MEKGQNLNDFSDVLAIPFKHDASTSKKIYDEFKGGKDLFPKDILESHRKKHPSNIISEKTIELNHIMNPNDTLESLKQEVQDSEWIISNYQPSFTNDELHEYYQDIKNGMWADFCSKIHIPGDTNEKMKQYLLKAESNPGNAWAFKEGVYKQPDFEKGYLLRRYGHLL